MSTFLKKPLLWISFIIISAISFAFAFKFFPIAFPIVNITISMDRGQAISASDDLATRFSWGPKTPSTAASFYTDSKAQRFIELDGGGQGAFLQMIQHNWYMPYTWVVRRFSEFDPHETEVYFTPDGKPYGFEETLPEDMMLPAISKKEGLALVQDQLTNSWQVNLEPYKMIEYAKEIQPNGRIDRSFVFERTDINLEEGSYRIKTKVSGNKITQVRQFIKIPQTFEYKYRQMRSANESIASAAGMFAYVFYILIGCLFGLFILMRLRWVIWQTPIKWALLVAGLKFLTTLNALPLYWMQYNTENGMQGFLLNIIVQAFSLFFMSFIMNALIFITAESLTRRAFGHQVRLWDSWDSGVANSYTILGYSIGSYLIIGIDMAFLVGFYMISTTYFNWWVPMSQLIDPNVLAYYAPWLYSIASSLSAGFVEEAQFRAIPLAGAALLGDRFGKRKWWIFSAFILQAIIFGAAHANYPAQPAYARLVELIVPSFIFGALYLRFGLLTSVIMHFAYDVIWFSLPIFLSTAPGIWTQQLAVLCCTFLPIFIVLYRRWQAGRWQKLSPDAYNGTWVAPNEPPITTQDVAPTIHKTLTHKQRSIITGVAICAFAAWLYTTKFSSDAPPLKLYRNEAIQIAQQHLHNQQIALDGYEPHAQLKPTFEKKEQVDLQHKYMWQTYERPVYTSLLGTYLNPPHWLVRFLKFDSNLNLTERGELYEALVGASTFGTDPNYETLSWQHKVPENVAGVSLDKTQARKLAQEALMEHGINFEDVYEVSATPKQLPNRVDWTFKFANAIETDTKRGELHTIISIAGDKINHFYQKIHVPEVWKREEQKQRKTTNALTLLCNLLIRMLFIFSMLIALHNWASKKLQTRTFICSLGFFAILFIIKLIYNWPNIIAQFNTQAPFVQQAFMQMGMLSLQFLMRAAIFAFVLSLIIHIKQKFAYKKNENILLIGLTGGLLLSGSWSLIKLFDPSVEPLWGFYNTLGTWLPWLGYVNSLVLKYLQYTLAFIVGAVALNHITNFGKQRLTLATTLCILASLCMHGSTNLDVISYWLSSSIVFGIVLFAVWYTLLRYSIASIPFVFAATFSLQILQQIMFDVLPHMLLAGILTILAISILAWLLSTSMRRQYV